MIRAGLIALLIALAFWFWPRAQNSAVGTVSPLTPPEPPHALLDEVVGSPHEERAPTPLESIERLVAGGRLEALEKMFSNATELSATDKADLIDAAISLDDPRLIARAEALAIHLIENGDEAEVLAVLPKISLFPENSPLKNFGQESFCRFHGFGAEVVKLKFDRLFPNAQPWSTVCKT